MEPYVRLFGFAIYGTIEEFEDNMGVVGALNLQYKFAKRPIH